MKNLILTLSAICALSCGYASQGEVTDYNPNTGTYKVGAPKSIKEARKPTRAEITDTDPRQMNESSKKFLSW